MATQIRAIETVYNGYRFRSRLEARWAVFFDALGIEYEYEKEGYDLGEAGWYLPDFWLPQVHMWAEVKAVALNAPELAKLEALVSMTKFSGLMLEGVPTSRNYWAIDYWETSDYEGPMPWDDDYVAADAAREEEAAVVPHLAWTDYWLTESSRYWLHESRFYGNTGISAPDVENPGGNCKVGCLCKWCDLDGAITAARSARFEHGESPK